MDSLRFRDGLPDMDRDDFQTVVNELLGGKGLASKADIGAVAARLNLAGAATRVGDDCAAIPDGDGHLLFAIEGFINGFVAADPWFAGWCGLMVNLSDIAAMGGRPMAVVDALWAQNEAHAADVLDGLRAAAEAYGVPIVGGHSNLTSTQAQLAVAVIGRAGPRLLTSFDARPGDVLIAAIDHRGAYREPFDNWQAALDAPATRLRGDLLLLPEIAEAGLCRAAKDISQAGLVGTAVMLAESSGVGIDLDLDAIAVPAGVGLGRWLRSFPSFGFLLAIPPRDAAAITARFEARDIRASVVGSIVAGSEVRVRSGGYSALIRDHHRDRLMGFGPSQEAV
jgi:AIR synthase-related protein